MSWLTQESIADVKGIGEVTYAKLAGAGLKTKQDLLDFLPRKYQEVTFIESINQIQPGQITLKAKAKNVRLQRTNRALTLLHADLIDQNGDKLRAVWFNQPYRQNQIKNGWFYFSGQFELVRGRWQLTNPSVNRATKANQNLAQSQIEPIYSSLRGLKSSFFKKTLRQMNGEMMLLQETLPEILLDKFELPSRSDTYLQLHAPTTQERLTAATKRYKFERYFVASLAGALGKANLVAEAPQIQYNLDLIKQIVASLPFELTNDQRRVIWQIVQDMVSQKMMNRLLQGDVGSGKTIVAFVAALVAAEQKWQTAILAPTEILAKQHFQGLQKLLDQIGSPVKTGLLTSAVPTAKKRQLKQQLANGEVMIAIGTHALLQDDVIFDKLGFVVIDEQHRFGVKQRQTLLERSNQKLMPHLLSMTATPIPRSLALVLQNELSISSLRQKPAGRQPINTKIISPSKKSAVYDQIKQQLDAGRQGYVICGLVTDSEASNRHSAETMFEELSTQYFKKYRIGLLHGQLKADQKSQIMQDFAEHKYDLLVATTVIEVGIDVANATFLLIEDADYYGLSQLHQLRGRVGRGEHQSYCWLVSEQTPVSERLKAIETTDDGFKLAEVDLKLRGMGDLYGQAQHGWFDFEADLATIELAQAAIEFYQQDLAKRQTDLSTDLEQNFPELWEEVNQFENLNVLN